MKKRLAVVLTIVLALSILLGTVAYAAPGDGNGAGAQPTDKGQPTDQAMKRWQFMEQVKPLIQKIANNREQIRTMTQELAALRLQVKEHLGDLKDDPESLTEEQIQLLKQLRTQLRECKDALIATNGDMSQHRLRLRQMRRDRNYEEVLAAYGKVITVQEERMQQLSKMKEICGQIISVG